MSKGRGGEGGKRGGGEGRGRRKGRTPILTLLR